MPIQQTCIRCPNCGDRIVLPLESHLGKFDGQLSPSKDIWPINFLCPQCGKLSEIPVQAIHLEELETPGQNQLVRYDFASDQSGSVQHVAIYTKEVCSDGDEDEIVVGQIHEADAVELVLKPSGLWRDSWGENLSVSVDRGLKCNTPKRR